MHKGASLILGFGLMLVSGAAVVIAAGWPWKAALFPIAIGIPVFCMAAAEVLWGLLGPAARVEAPDFQFSDEVPRGIAIRRTLQAIAWMGGFFGAIVLTGFGTAVPLFVFLFLRAQGRDSWLFCAAYAAAVWAIFYAIFDYLLHLPFPAGLIQTWLGFA